MKDIYQTQEHETISLASLNREEKTFLAALFQHFEQGTNYFSFKRMFKNPSSPISACARRTHKEVEETPLYKVCDDLAKQLGIAQGYLVKEEVTKYAARKSPEQRELTTGEVAKLAGCTPQAVRKAIATWRLKARRVGYLSLILAEDAQAFARSLRGRHHSAHPGKKRQSKELAHA